MDLFEAKSKGLPLVIETGAGGDRLAAEIFRLAGGGAIFADIGWPEASFHPFHTLDGEIRETSDGWAIGDTPVRVAFSGEQLFIDWQQWQAWRVSDYGQSFGPDVCRQAMASDLGVDPLPDP